MGVMNDICIKQAIFHNIIWLNTEIYFGKIYYSFNVFLLLTPFNFG